MSEYTKYFAVKSSSDNEVMEKLNQNKIISIVDSDIEGFWFSDEYKTSGSYNWVVVSAPGEIKGSFYFEQSSKLKDIFDIFILFFQEENLIDWSIEVYYKDIEIEKEFYSNCNIEFTEEEKEVFSKSFDKPFSELEKFLVPGKGSNFLNFIGIPYMEMADQSHISNFIVKDNKYSFLANEIDD